MLHREESTFRRMRVGRLSIKLHFPCLHAAFLPRGNSRVRRRHAHDPGVFWKSVYIYIYIFIWNTRQQLSPLGRTVQSVELIRLHGPRLRPLCDKQRPRPVHRRSREELNKVWPALFQRTRHCFQTVKEIAPLHRPGFIPSWKTGDGDPWTAGSVPIEVNEPTDFPKRWEFC